MGNFILNTVWFIPLGAILSLIVLTAGVVLCCTIIGIPLGIVCFQKAMVVAFPFGRDSKNVVVIKT